MYANTIYQSIKSCQYITPSSIWVEKIFIVYLQINYKHYIMKSIGLIAKLLILAGLVQGQIISLEVCPYEMKFPL